MKVVVVVGPDVRGMVLLLTTRADAGGGREMRMPDMVELERLSQDASTESSSHHRNTNAYGNEQRNYRHI